MHNTSNQTSCLQLLFTAFSSTDVHKYWSQLLITAFVHNLCSLLFPQLMFTTIDHNLCSQLMDTTLIHNFCPELCIKSFGHYFCLPFPCNIFLQLLFKNLFNQKSLAFSNRVPVNLKLQLTRLQHQLADKAALSYLVASSKLVDS